MAAYLSIVSGLPPQTLSLTEPGSFLVGRAPDCALVLVHAEVSRHHCRLDWDGKSCAVEDLGSRRGTLWNGSPLVAKAGLHTGDRIAIGPIVLEFAVGDRPEAPKYLPPAATAGGTPMLVRGKVSDHIAPVADTELVIGRDPQCDVVLNHSGVSRKHASFRLHAGRRMHRHRPAKHRGKLRQWPSVRFS